jgi:NitT/TauT family transport system substrate-binding protein
MHTVGRVIRAIGVCVLAALAAGCTQDRTPPLRVGTNVWPGYEPLYLARDLELLDPDGVRLVEYSSASQVIRAYRNGRIDAAALTLDEVLLLLASGLEPRVALVMDISHGADAILARPGVDGLADLKGRRVGVENTALGAYVLSRALEQAGMSVDDVDVVEVEVDAHEGAYRGGEVDAVVTFEPVRSRLLAAGAHVVFDSTRIPGEIVDVLAVRREVLNRRPEVVRGVLRAWFGAVDRLHAHPREGARRIAERLRLDPEAVLKSYDGLELPDRTRNRWFLAGPDGPGLAASARRLAAVMEREGLVAHPVDPAQLFDADFGLLPETPEPG